MTQTHQTPDTRASAAESTQESTAPQVLAARTALVILTALVLLVVVGHIVAPSLVSTALAELQTRALRFDAERIGMYMLLLGSAFAIDLSVLGWRGSAIRQLLAGSRSARTDILIAAIHILGWASIVVAMVSLGATFAFELIVKRGFSFNLIQLLPAWAQVLLVFIVVDFIDYWYHRASHVVSFLWEAHKYHHSATSFTVLTGNRTHALEELTRKVMSVVPLTILGAPPEMLVGVRILLSIIDLLQHSMLPWTYGWVGRWLFYSPVGHRIHHSTMPEHWDLNYGNLLVIWDRLFRTWYDGRTLNADVDVSANPYNRSAVVVDYLVCIARYAQAFMYSLRNGRWRTQPARLGIARK